MDMLKKRQNEVFLGKKMLNNRYTLAKKIGEGGLSEVYEASDIYAQYFNDTRDLVIKLPLQEIATKKDMVAFVYSEYSLLNKIRHENIVKVLDFGIDEESELAYIVMERLDGNLLMNIPIHSMSKKMKNNIAFSLYKSIEYIHSLGIVHADINPTNLMVADSGYSQLFDFGISQNLRNKTSFSLDYNKMNAFNPRYSAPEVLEGNSPTIKTDLFSLACVLFELYTGELPFKDSSLELKESQINPELLRKIPFLQRSWFVTALEYDENMRDEKIPFFIRLNIYLSKCSKMGNNETQKCVFNEK
jgi:serine/threonine protein kinase